MAKKQQKELDGRKMSTGTRIIVAIFAVVMALSMMLPSLAPIFAGTSSSEENAEETEATDEASTSESKTEEAQAPSTNSELDKILATVPENDTLKSYAEQYNKSNEPFLKRLKENDKDLAALLNLGQNYMSWGSSAIYSSTTDDEKAYSEALLKKAMEYYDRYLALNDSDAVKVSRAACDYYLGNTEQAIATLKEMTEKKPDYPLAWAYLGMFYEQGYDMDNAKAAYEKAAETDAKDEYGVKTYAEGRIDSINSAGADFSSLTNENLLGTSSSPQEGLPGVIANNSSV